jgi:hypothetical protein
MADEFERDWKRLRKPVDFPDPFSPTRNVTGARNLTSLNLRTTGSPNGNSSSRRAAGLRSIERR